jgi:hypothetical protein
MNPSSPTNPKETAPDDATWTRRFTASEPRLSEMAALYRSLGLEVTMGEATLEPGQECLACLPDPSVRTIYTRPAPRRRRLRGRPVSAGQACQIGPAQPL